MKKVFLFLATAALFASCSDDLLEPNNGFQAQDLSSKGITFQVVNDATRGMIDETNYSAYFFAEKDRISIWSKNATTWNITSSTWSTTYTAWPTTSVSGSPVIYKATKSQGNPNFTAINDDNLLGFREYNTTAGKSDENKADFFVAYPALSEAKDESSNLLPQTVTEDKGTFTIYPNIDLGTQKMSGYMNLDKRLMYDYIGGVQTTAGDKEKNASVGEKVNMSLQTPLAAAFFSCTDLDDYVGALGELQSVTLTSEYSPLVPNITTSSETKKYTVKAEDVVKAKDGNYYLYGDVTPKHENKAVKEYEPKKGVTQVKENDQITTVKADNFTYKAADEQMAFKAGSSLVRRSATLDVTGSKIQSGTMMNLYILPTTGHSSDNPEKYTISYKFKDATLTYTQALTINPGKDGDPYFEFKIADHFNYIVSNDGKSLVVNKGGLSDILNSEKTKVKWGAGDVLCNSFETIIINSGVTASTNDFELLSKFTNTEKLTIKTDDIVKLGNIQSLTKLVELEANKVKSVDAAAFATAQLTTLKKLSLHSVTEFPAQTAFTAASEFTALTYLDIHSYPSIGLSKQIPTTLFFNDKTKNADGTDGKGLAYIDISALTSLQPDFYGRKAIKFDGYSKLKEIHLNADGVQVNDYQFMNCYALETVVGAVDLTGTEGAFYCEKETDGDGKRTAATTPKLTKVNLANECTTIPEGSFCGSLVKNLYETDGKTPIKPVEIGMNAFNGNEKIEELDLSAATTIGAGAFNGATAFKSNKDASVTLKVVTVEKDAFNGTAIEIFKLDNAKYTKSGSLNSKELDKIWYVQDLDKSLTYDDDGDPTTDEVNVIDANQIDSAKKTSVSIFINNLDDKLHFAGYTNVTVQKEK